MPPSIKARPAADRPCGRQLMGAPGTAAARAGAIEMLATTETMIAACEPRSRASDRSLSRPRRPMMVSSASQRTPTSSSAVRQPGSLRTGESVLDNSVAPVARIPELAIDGPAGELGDHRQAPLVLVVPDHAHHLLDEAPAEAFRLQLSDPVAAVDQVVEETVHDPVLEPQLGLVRLARPEVGRGRLLHDLSRHTQALGQPPDLSLVEVAERIDGAGHVARDGPVAEQQLGLVAGSEHERAPGPGLVVEDGHTLARHLVAATPLVGLGKAREVAVDLGTDVDCLTGDAELLHARHRVRPAPGIAAPVGQEEGPDGR